MSEESYVKTSDGRYVAIGGEEFRAIKEEQAQFEKIPFHTSDALKDEIHLISFAKPDDPEEDVVEVPVPNEPGRVWRINKRRTAVLRNIESMEPARSAGEGQDG